MDRKKIYAKPFIARQRVVENVRMTTAEQYWNNLWLCMYVVDGDGKFLGLLGRKELFHTYSPPDKVALTVGDACNRRATTITAASLDATSALDQAAELFDSIPALTYIPVLDAKERPLGCLYRGTNSVERNRSKWDEEAGWEACDDGDDWSGNWGSPAALWYGTLLPRVANWVDADDILEIAPSHGRCTQYLIPHAKRYRGVDVSGECAAFCRRRFADRKNAEFFRNDGRRLDMIEDGACDFVFSYDSLIHAEMDSVASYVGECVRVMRKDGVAFLHHSNLGEEPDPFNEYWNAFDVSAGGVRAAIEAAGGTPLLQECFYKFNASYMQCFTLFSKTPRPGHVFQRLDNEFFEMEMMLIRNRINRYLSIPAE